MSTTGDPSSMSTPATRSLLPSRPSSRTTVRPSGFGRRGDRVANTPCGRVSVGGVPQECRVAGAVEDPDDVEVREPLDVGETGREIFAHFDDALRVVLRAASLRDVRCGGVRCPDDANGVQGNHALQSIAGGPPPPDNGNQTACPPDRTAVAGGRARNARAATL